MSSDVPNFPTEYAAQSLTDGDSSRSAPRTARIPFEEIARKSPRRSTKNPRTHSSGRPACNFSSKSDSASSDPTQAQSSIAATVQWRSTALRRRSRNGWLPMVFVGSQGSMRNAQPRLVAGSPSLIKNSTRSSEQSPTHPSSTMDRSTLAPSSPAASLRRYWLQYESQGCPLTTAHPTNRPNHCTSGALHSGQ